MEIMGLIKRFSFQKGGIIAISLIMAFATLYAYKTFSIIMPALTLLILIYQGNLRELKIPLSLPFIFSLLLLILAGASIFWVGNKTLALKTFFGLSLTYVFSLLFIAAVLRVNQELLLKAFKIFYIASYCLLFLVIFQAFANYFLSPDFKSSPLIVSMIKPTGSIIGLFAFVGCGLLWADNKKLLSIFIFACLFMVILLTKCQTGFYSLIIAFSAFILTYGMPKGITRFFLIGSYTFLILSPVTYSYIFTLARLNKLPFFSGILNNSFFYRSLVWEWYSKKFLEGPLLGRGLESGREFSSQAPSILESYKMTVHAHNNSLQAFAELGILGGVIFALFASSFFWIVEKNVKDRLSVAVCNATIIYALVEAQVTHNLWRNYWISLLTIAAGFVIVFLKAREAQLRVEGDHLKQPLSQYSVWGLLKSS